MNVAQNAGSEHIADKLTPDDSSHKNNMSHKTENS